MSPSRRANGGTLRQVISVSPARTTPRSRRLRMIATRPDDAAMSFMPVIACSTKVCPPSQVTNSLSWVRAAIVQPWRDARTATSSAEAVSFSPTGTPMVDGSPRRSSRVAARAQPAAQARPVGRAAGALSQSEPVADSSEYSSGLGSMNLAVWCSCVRQRSQRPAHRARMVPVRRSTETALLAPSPSSATRPLAACEGSEEPSAAVARWRP